MGIEQFSHLRFAEYLEMVADDYDESGSEATAEDYRESAKRIREFSTPIYDQYMIIDLGDLDTHFQDEDGNTYSYCPEYVADYRDDHGALDFYKFIDDHHHEMRGA